MINQYAKILQIIVFHSYFNEGKAKNLILRPSGKTKTLFDNYGLLLRSEEDGIVLLGKKDQEENNQLQYLLNTKGEEEFEIEIYTEDGNFYVYTELPLNKIGELEYSNEEIESGVDSDAKVLKQKFKDTSSTNKLGSIKFDIEELISQTSNGPVTFEIRFEARQTQWNYYIITPSQMEGLKIESKSDVSYSGPEEVTLANSSKALKFSSGTELLQLQEYPSQKFNLVQEENSRRSNLAPNMILQGLPNANPNKIDITELDGRQVASSEMYVYI